MNTEVMFSSENSEWETPDGEFQYWNAIFRFSVDLAATEHNAKLPVFISPEQDTLLVDWLSYGDAGWLNPPYGDPEMPCHPTRCKKKRCKPGKRGHCIQTYRPGIIDFVRKCVSQQKLGFTTVALLPSRTGSGWWQECVERNPDASVRHLPGRQRFIGAENSAPFDSAIVIFWGAR